MFTPRLGKAVKAFEPLKINPVAAQSPRKEEMSFEKIYSPGKISHLATCGIALLLGARAKHTFGNFENQNKDSTWQ